MFHWQQRRLLLTQTNFANSFVMNRTGTGGGGGGSAVVAPVDAERVQQRVVYHPANASSAVVQQPMLADTAAQSGRDSSWRRGTDDGMGQ